MTFRIPYYQELLDDRATKQRPYPSLLCWDVYRMALNQQAMLLESMKVFNKMAYKMRWDLPIQLNEELFGKRRVMLVTDMKANICFVTPNVYQMSGFEAEELIGNTPAVLQGPGTEKQVLKQISEAIQHGKSFTACLTNYRKNKKPYLCSIDGYPLRDKRSIITHYMAFEHEL